MHNLSGIVFTVTDLVPFDIAAVAVGNAIDETGDEDLANAWNQVSPAYHDFLDAPVGSQEEFATFQDWRTTIANYLAILQERLTASLG
jgi:hypothetical protein